MEPVPAKLRVVMTCYRGHDKVERGQDKVENVKKVMDMVVRLVCIILKVNCSSKLCKEANYRCCIIEGSFIIDYAIYHIMFT